MRPQEPLSGPPPGRSQRTPALLALAGLLATAFLAPGRATADEAGPRRVAGAPDLVLDRAGVEMGDDGETLTVSVVNRGNSPSPGFTVRISDRPFLGAEVEPGGYFPHHRVLRDERALVIWPEYRDNTLVLRVRWHGAEGRDPFYGRVRLEDIEHRPLSVSEPGLVGAVETSAVRQGDDGWVTWDALSAPQPAGFDLMPGDEERPAFLVVDELMIAGAPNLHEIYIGNWWLSRYLRNPELAEGPSPAFSQHPDEEVTLTGPGRITIPLDDLRLTQVSHPAPLWTMETRLSGLDPGARSRAVFALPAAVPQVHVLADPDDEVIEQREGNNASTWRSQPDHAMVSLHTHASLSEGYASFDAQMDQLTRSGYDAVFWTEHDWRLVAHEMLAELSFEEEPVPTSWSVVVRRLDPGLEAEISLTDDRATSGMRALRLSGRRTAPSNGAPPQAVWGLRVYRARIIRSLAEELSVAFDLYADPDNPFDAEFLLQVELSDQPHVRRHLSYRIGILPDALASPQVVLPVPPDLQSPGRVAIPPRRFTRIVLPLSEHARILLPEGVDNNLSSLQLGLALRSGTARFDVDHLTFETAVQGLDLLEVQRRWGESYPAIHSYVSTEISNYIPHFNAFVRDPVLLDYRAVGARTYAAEARRSTLVADGALSLNHPMGFNEAFPDGTSAGQIDARLFGADLLEVGYRLRGGAGLVGHLAFWDAALAAGIPVTGIGVTDAHGAGRGNGFERDENNFATWLDADPASVDSLIDALLAGSTSFGDPVLHRGVVDLAVDGVYTAGNVVIGAPRAHTAVFRGDRVEPGGRLDLVIDGQVASSVPVGPDGRARGEAPLPAGTGSARVEMWGPQGEPVAFSSAIIFTENLPPESLPASRLRIETDHGLVIGEGRFRVDTVEAGNGRLRIEGRRGQGQLRVQGAGSAPVATRVPGGATLLASQYEVGSDTFTVPLRPPGVALDWSAGSKLPAWVWWAGPATLLLFVAITLWTRPRRRRRRTRAD